MLFGCAIYGVGGLGGLGVSVSSSHGSEGAGHLPGAIFELAAPPNERLAVEVDRPIGAKVAPAASATTTFLGMSDALLLARMRTSEITSLQFNRGGSSISFRVDFADGSRAALKPEQKNPQTTPRKEAAAYRLSRLLDLNVVAPVVMRPLRREELLAKLSRSSHWARRRVEAETLFDENGQTLGSFAYWIPTVVDLQLDTNEGVNRWTSWLSQGREIPSEHEALMAQLSTLLIFDLLQNNSDRFSGGNLLGSAETRGTPRMLYFMDNAFGFQADPEGNLRCWTYLRRSQKFSRKLVQALEGLDLQRLRQAMAGEGATDGEYKPHPPLLSDEEMSALLGRRDRALAYIHGLSQTYGTERVLIFP